MARISIDRLLARKPIDVLLAFAMICAGMMYLRIRHPEIPRAFKPPVWWLTAPLGIASCIYLIASLPVATFWRLLIWMGIGLVIYTTYAYRHSLYHETGAVTSRNR
jgi:APA family basic amino acid/polyamine antiporter